MKLFAFNRPLLSAKTSPQTFPTAVGKFERSKPSSYTFCGFRKVREVNKNPLESTSKNVTILVGLLGKGLLSPASYFRKKKKLAIWSCPSCPIQWFHSSQQCRPGTLNDTCGTRVFCIKTKKSVARKKGKVTQQLSIWIFIWCWIPFFDFESWIPFLIWCPFFGFELEIPFSDFVMSLAVGQLGNQLTKLRYIKTSKNPSCEPPVAFKRGILQMLNKCARWFKVTFSSPNWRSLNPLKGSLNHPKKVTLNHQVCELYSNFRSSIHFNEATWRFLARVRLSLHKNIQ